MNVLRKLWNSYGFLLKEKKRTKAIVHCVKIPIEKISPTPKGKFKEKTKKEINISLFKENEFENVFQF